MSLRHEPQTSVHTNPVGIKAASPNHASNLLLHATVCFLLKRHGDVAWQRYTSLVVVFFDAGAKTYHPPAAPADQSNEQQSNAADTLEEEQKEREAHDGSLWWHGMFVKAGRMGNMAADVQAGSKPEVRAILTGTPLAQYQGCSVCSRIAL